MVTQQKQQNYVNATLSHWK